MRGAAELVCHANKRYNHPPPVCETISCGMPPELLNTNRNGEIYLELFD